MKIEHVVKKIKDGFTLQVSFEIKSGEIIGVIGINGAGKTTLLSVLAGVSKVDSGIITRNGKVGYVPQENRLFDRLTVKDNIDFWSKANKIKYTSKYFDKKMLSKKVEHLSGGNKKLLAIELALIGEPKYLILDEPTSSLDLINQIKILDLMKELRKENKSIIFSTHNIDEINQCDKLLVIKEGKISTYKENKKVNDRNEIINYL